MSFAIKYPRRVVIRKILLAIARVIIKLLTHFEVTGLENIPKTGPLILAGNHVASLEALLMAAYSPRLVEFLGTGDIPFDSAYAWITELYGLIPVNRGNLDREALKKASDVLLQKGVLGIFPEGGIWNPAQMEAQIGVALISQRTNAPIIPIGFGGIRGALPAALHLKKPKITMDIGRLIPAVILDQQTGSTKQVLQAAANEILKQIDLLIPPAEKQAYKQYIDHKYELEISVLGDRGNVDIPADLQVSHGSAYAHFLYSPVLLDALFRNLELPILPLMDMHPPMDLVQLRSAWQVILQYLDNTNSGFFTYRFGMEEGLAVQQALKELTHLLDWVMQNHYSLQLKAVHAYLDTKSNQQLQQNGGEFPTSMVKAYQKSNLKKLDR